jgi:hypothetical protein
VVINDLETEAAFVFFNWGLGERSAKQWRGRFVIDGVVGAGPGFQITPDNSVSGIDVSICGYILSLP